MGCPALRRPSSWFVVGGALLLSLPAPVPAQQPSGPDVKIAPKDATDPTLQIKVRGMRDGRESVSKEELDNFAKYLVYRMTYPQAWNPKEPGYGQSQSIGGVPIKPIHMLVQEAKDYIQEYPSIQPGRTPRPPLNPTQIQYQQLFGKAMRDRLKEVLSNKEPIVRVNAARLLFLLSLSGYEELADLYLEIINKTDPDDRLGGEPQKLFALQGLRTLLAIRTDNEAPAGTVIKNFDRYKRIVEDLTKFIQRKPTYAADAPPEEIEGFRWVRRAAIEALAQVRSQAIRNPPRTGNIVLTPALTLLKVANRDGLTPEPNIAERVEAVVGFCNMISDNELEIDYAVYKVGQFFHELAVSHRNGVEAYSVPWKVAGARLSLALKAWQQEVANLPKGRNGALVGALANRADADVLGPLEQGNMAGLNPDGFGTWLKDNQPKSSSLFRNRPNDKIEPGRPPQFGTPEKP